MFIKNLISENIINLLKQSDSSSGNFTSTMVTYSTFIFAGWGVALTLMSDVAVEMLFIYNDNKVESDFYTEINFVGLNNAFQNELKYSTTPIFFVSPIDFKMTYFSSVPEALTYIIANISGIDITITITLSLLSLKRSFFDDWYRKVFKYYYKNLEKIVDLRSVF